jgi:hypothetical protein
MTEQRRPPTHTLWAKLRTKDGSKPKAFKIGSAWTNEFGGHNIRLEAPWQRRDGSNAPGVLRIEMSDGTIITPESHWLDMRDEAENARRFPKREDGAAPAPRHETTDGPAPAAQHAYGGEDDLPF